MISTDTAFFMMGLALLIQYR